MGSKNSIAKNLIKQLPRAAEFKEVYNIEKTVLLSSKSNSIKAVEKLFIPRKNKLHFEEVEQLTLYWKSGGKFWHEHTRMALQGLQC